MHNADKNSLLASLTTEQQQHMTHAEASIKQVIAEQNGQIAFDQFMEMALYQPGLGYYVSGTQKFGIGGDFVTAPEISPLFGRCIARQCAQVLEIIDGDILEFGAGSGTMAADILLELQAMDKLPEHYLILEPSPELQYRQKATLMEKAPALLDKVQWLDRLPKAFNGVMLGNEVLDAMPVSRFRKNLGNLEEQFVRVENDKLTSFWHETGNQQLIQMVKQLETDQGNFSDGFESEINTRLPAWMNAVDKSLQTGVLLLIDYGYEAAAYYHPDRYMGTLICHFQHQAHADPLVLSGLQDITANVDFTAIARATLSNDLCLAGYTTQVNFLLGSGLDQLISGTDDMDETQRIKLMQGVKQLTLPSEMGERFKVIACSKNTSQNLMGFQVKDLTARL